MRIIVLFLIACLWACNQAAKDEVLVAGKIENCKGNRIYFEVCGQDSLVKVQLDTSGCFSVPLKLSGASYVRLMNGSVAFPLYLTPGMKVKLDMDIQKIKDGGYESVTFPEGINKETRMMAHYYQNQWFPATQEMFVYPPVEFKQMMDSVVRYNDEIVDRFLTKDAEKYDPDFVRLFKLQIKVPFAASYFYYPMYHSLLNPGDTSREPENFNIFDEMLPKNDSVIYNKVYRYKTYEVSYWNNRITETLAALAGEPEKFFDAYFDILAATTLHPQIKDDVAHTFLTEQINGMSPGTKEIVRSRYKEVMTESGHLRQFEKMIDGSGEN